MVPNVSGNRPMRRSCRIGEMSMPRFRLIAWLVAAFAFAIPVQTIAGDDVFTDETGIAIRGYDPVAYFTLGRPVEGAPEFEYEWRGTTWRFASEEHLDRFAAEPRSYAPRYGGYCAGAMSRGFKASIDPEAFAIIDGKLYLAYARPGIEEFEDEADERIPTADANWMRLGQTE